jgi:hypothetical protein
MKTRILMTGLISLLGSTAGWAQLTETQMKAFPVPPPKAYVVNKHFAYLGDEDYTTNSYDLPTLSIYGRAQPMGFGDLDYFRYTGIKDKHLVIWTEYRGTTAMTEGSCAHTHLEYGIKGKYQLQLFNVTYKGWAWLGGGLKSGDWDQANQYCSRTTHSRLGQSIPEFGWGTDEVDIFNRRVSKNGVTQKGYHFTVYSNYIDEIVMAAVAPTHGAGDCEPSLDPATGFSFKQCLDHFEARAFTH